MPAHKKVSEDQERILLQFMQANPDKATGRASHQTGPMAKQQVAKFWELVAARLNATGSGTTKVAHKWRDYWSERKYAVRSKAAKMRAHTGTTKALKLSDVEQRILSLIGNEPISREPRPPSTSTSSQQQTEYQEAENNRIVINDRMAEDNRETENEQKVENNEEAEGDNRDVASACLSAPAWAIEIETRRWEAENRRLEVQERIAQGVERLATACEANTELLRLLLDTVSRRKL